MFLTKISSICVAIFLSLNAFALPQSKENKRERPLWGHVVTGTADTLPHELSAVGSLFIGHGINPSLTVLTIPQIFFIYNMVSAGTRLGHHFTEFYSTSADLIYMKSVPAFGGTYKQENFYFRSNHTFKINNAYRIHATFGVQYFLVDDITYSLRLNPSVYNPTNFSLTHMHEVWLDENTGINIELGLIGINYNTPYLQAGTSFFLYDESDFSINLGASISYALGKTQNYKIYHSREHDYVIHPEIQFQYYF